MVWVWTCLGLCSVDVGLVGRGNEVKVLMMINTTGLEYDDRLRKEALSLRRLGCHVEILAMEYANQAAQRVVYQSVPARTIRLRSRGWFARSKGLWLKVPEMYARFLAAIVRTHPDVIWFHSLGLTGLAPFLILMRRIGFIQRLIWDQHELPSDHLLAAKCFLTLFVWLLNGCDYVVMANEQRGDLVQELLDDELSTPIEVLENYPDREFIDLPKHKLPSEIERWLEGIPYVLAQGGANPNRHLEELVDAVMTLDCPKLVVVGPYQQQQIDQLHGLHGEEFPEKVLFTGFVPQMDIVSYIDHALVSVVFYDTSVTNGRLCASNRLYQAICRGTPVIVSENPPMKDVVDQYGFGLVVDCGSSKSIVQALKKIISSQRLYRERAMTCSEVFVWEDQIERIREILRGATEC